MAAQGIGRNERIGWASPPIWSGGETGSIALSLHITAAPSNIRDDGFHERRPDCDYIFLVRIDDGKWKSPQQESADVVASKRPTFWRFSDCLCGAIEFLDEVQGNFRFSFFIPSEGILTSAAAPS